MLRKISSVFSTDVTAGISIVCAYDSCEPVDSRVWRGKIVAKGLHGSVQALFARMSQRIQVFKTPLMGIITVCAECAWQICVDDRALVGGGVPSKRPDNGLQKIYTCACSRCPLRHFGEWTACKPELFRCGRPF